MCASKLGSVKLSALWEGESSLSTVIRQGDGGGNILKEPYFREVKNKKVEFSDWEILITYLSLVFQKPINLQDPKNSDELLNLLPLPLM